MQLVVATMLPLAAFVVEFILGRRLGKLGAYLSTAAIGLAFCISSLVLLRYVSVFPESMSASQHHASHEGEAGSHDDHGHGHGKSKLAEGLTAPVLDQGSFAWATLYQPQGGDKPKRFFPTEIRLGYRIDNLTVLMFTMVTFIATCIHLYSIGYMSHEPRFHRFFMYLSLFCFSMLNLIIADNYFQIFISWELVGVCSYLLIGFYYEKRSASNAANKAFITNRVGDVGFIVGLMAMYANFGTFNFADLFGPTGMIDPKADISHFWLTVAGLGIFIGCVGKSAQFPLHVWLPDAMEGPTPVSALIHAATMVAAGVYLTARSMPLFTPEALLIIAYVGGITLFVAASIAVVATDIKKALAYSTISQLGYMMMALGLGGYVAGLMHLITHAFFKALMFLCSGSVIHGTGTQEMPQMGGLHKKMPVTSITMLIGVLAISGAPFFSGFYSKDAIVAQVIGYAQTQPTTHLPLLFLPIVTAGITAFYMFRLWFMTFTGEARDHHVHDHAHESPRIMTGPLVALAILSVVGAGLPWWVWLQDFITFGQPASVTAGPMEALQHAAHESHALATLIASGVAGVGILLAAAVYYWGWLNPKEAQAQFPAVYDLLVNKWYFDELYSVLLVRPSMIVAKVCVWVDRVIIDALIDRSAKETIRIANLDGDFDKGVVDGAVNLVGDAVQTAGFSFRHVQTGRLRNYVLGIVLGSALLVALGAVLYKIPG